MDEGFGILADPDRRESPTSFVAPFRSGVIRLLQAPAQRKWKIEEIDIFFSPERSFESVGSYTILFRK